MALVETRPGQFQRMTGDMRRNMVRLVQGDRARLHGAPGYTPELLASVEYAPDGRGSRDRWECPETVKFLRKTDCDGFVRLGAVVYPRARIGFTGDGVREHTFLVLPGSRVLDYSGLRELAEADLGALSPTVSKWLKRAVRDMAYLAERGVIPAPFAAPWYLAARERSAHAPYTG